MQAQVAKSEEKEYDALKLRGVIGGLTEEECLLVWAIIFNRLPEKCTCNNDLVYFKEVLLSYGTKIFEGFFRKEPKDGYKKLKMSISRGLGKQVINPANGEIVVITQENLELGSRGKWHKKWRGSMKSLLEKMKKY